MTLINKPLLTYGMLIVMDSISFKIASASSLVIAPRFEPRRLARIEDLSIIASKISPLVITSGLVDLLLVTAVPDLAFRTFF